tara:strand:+ start:345 stop:1328 length:984 start_codon:yes stop_codon:yes gene_type:complete
MTNPITPTDATITNAGGGTATSTAPEDIVGKKTGTESALSNWVGPYVTDMLAQGAALAESPYEAYEGPLTAGPTAAQTAAFQGVANLAVPTAEMGTYTPQTFDAAAATSYMNPYIQTALDPQIAELQRQREISRINNAGRLSKAGAFGGSRQAVMDAELDRSYLDKASEITGLGYLDAYNKAQQQFNVEQGRAMDAQQMTNKYGLEALQQQAALGEQERKIEQAGIDADKAQFDFESAFPYKQVQFQQSLLQGLPLEAQSYSYAQPSALQNILSGAAGAEGLGAEIFGEGGIGALLANIFGSTDGTGGGNMTTVSGDTYDAFDFGSY